MRYAVVTVATPFALSALSWPAQAGPSFACRNLEHDAERTICNSAYLSRLDRRMARKYNELAVGMKAYSDYESLRELRATQRQWLKERNACGSDKDCIAARYQERLNVLGDWEYGEA
jgi:uncharacterized protein